MGKVRSKKHITNSEVIFGETQPNIPFKKDNQLQASKLAPL